MPKKIQVIIVVLVSTLFIGYSFFSYSKLNETTLVQDKRDCIPNEKISSIENFPIGLTYTNFGASGENGTFKENGVIEFDTGTEAGTTTSNNSRKGKWQFENNRLTIANTSLSNHTYTNFRFFIVNDSTIALPQESMSFVIGIDVTQIESFFKERIRPLIDYSITPELTNEVCQQLKQR